MIHNDVKILSGISKRDFSSPACASEKQGEVMFKSQLGHRMTLRSVLLSLLLLDQTTPKWSGTKWITPNLVPVMTCLSQEIWKCLAGQDKSHAVSGRWGSRRGWGWEGQKWGTGTAGAARGSLGMALHVGTSQGYSGLPCRLVASGQSDCLHGSSGLQLECSGELASLLPCSTDHPLTKGPQNQEATKCSGNLGAPPGPRDDL